MNNHKKHARKIMMEREQARKKFGDQNHAICWMRATKAETALKTLEKSVSWESPAPAGQEAVLEDLLETALTAVGNLIRLIEAGERQNG